jgi:L-alanine-DL-glutamate epimerase-like enolase superfamily enzyme
MRIEAVDFFYLSMPEVLDVGDGSQDALLVRVVADGHVGWGECEAAPLVSIASFVCPMSHSACKPVRDSVLGRAHAVGDRHRAVGSAGPRAGRAGAPSAGRCVGDAEAAVCVAAVRR